MKIRLVDLGFIPSLRYPYDYRVELVEYRIDEPARMFQWLKDNENTTYLRRHGANVFLI